ncbi:hypothetical protein [Metaclostridioides mangenotii]|uniref:hypothetical protein n=1 Tax=Metaclostridioides mangenotii TaxID=1540 RepID=UPI00214A2B4C|nr:hypothetical protein [Clostridioides mangenotii]
MKSYKDIIYKEDMNTVSKANSTLRNIDRQNKLIFILIYPVSYKLIIEAIKH